MLRNSSQQTPADSIATAETIRAVVVARKMFGESITLRLVAEADLQIVGCVFSAATAAREAEDLRADVAIVEYCLPDGNGVTVATEIATASPCTRVLVLAEPRDERRVASAFTAGCSGFLTTDADTAELVSAIRHVAAGGSYVPARLLPHLVPRLATGLKAVGTDLSPREREVLELLATGASTRLIANQLYVSVTTVRNHVQRILLKLSAHSKLEAVVIAVREGLIAGPN